MSDVSNIAKILEMQYNHAIDYDGADIEKIVLKIFTDDEYDEMWSWWMSIEWGV